MSITTTVRQRCPALLMSTFHIFLFITLCTLALCDDSDEPILYYYGLEESERGLGACGARQACSALVLRHWRAPALLRLCRCARRLRCDTRALTDRLVELNNRAYFQFCTPVTNRPLCSLSDSPLTVDTQYDRMDPDEIEAMHHQNVALVPPNVTLNCRCRYPNYWRLNSTQGTISRYQCGSMPLCKSGDFCGNVSRELNALYQWCVCPRRHECAHAGGVARHHIAELLHRGRGWRAHCRPLYTNYDEYYDQY